MNRQEIKLAGLTFVMHEFAAEFLLLQLHRRCQSTHTNAAATVPQIGKRLLDARFSFIDDVIATETEIGLTLGATYQDACLDRLTEFLNDADAACWANQVSQWKLPVHFFGDETGDETSVPSDASMDQRQRSVGARLETGSANADADDWLQVCHQTRLDRSQVIDRLRDLRLTVAMLGFQPGFVYLNGLPSELHVPRKATPSVRCVANAFALGGKYAGIYSLPSPAGWNVIGRVGIDLLTWDRLPPTSVSPGDHVQIATVSWAGWQRLQGERLSLAEFSELDQQTIEARYG